MWRLARQLAVEHRRQVRLHIDQPAVLQRLVPQAKHRGNPSTGGTLCWLDGATRCDSVTGCDSGRGGDRLSRDLPASFRARMAPGRPVWINLEYLSAEAWIEGFHRLPSPQPDGLIEHYFYPGFDRGSGGLLREADLFERRDRFQADPARPAASWPGSAYIGRRGDAGIAAVLSRRATRGTRAAACRFGSQAAAAGARRGRDRQQRRSACRSRWRAPAAQPHPVPAAAPVRRAAMVVRLQFRPRRGFAGSRHLVEPAVRLADLSTGRRRPRPQARVLPAACWPADPLPEQCAGGTGCRGPPPPPWCAWSETHPRGPVGSMPGS